MTVIQPQGPWTFTSMPQDRRATYLPGADGYPVGPSEAEKGNLAWQIGPASVLSNLALTKTLLTSGGEVGTYTDTAHSGTPITVTKYNAAYTVETLSTGRQQWVVDTNKPIRYSPAEIDGVTVSESFFKSEVSNKSPIKGLEEYAPEIYNNTLLTRYLNEALSYTGEKNPSETYTLLGLQDTWDPAAQIKDGDGNVIGYEDSPYKDRVNVVWDYMKINGEAVGDIIDEAKVKTWVDEIISRTAQDGRFTVQEENIRNKVKEISTVTERLNTEFQQINARANAVTEAISAYIKAYYDVLKKLIG